MSKNVIVRIAGAAGDGIASASELFGKTCSRQGLHVKAYNAYQSAIRGGHVWMQMNIGEDKTLSHGEAPEIAVLLNRTSPELHVPQMKSGAVVFYNAATIKKENIETLRDDVTYYGINFKELVEEQGLAPVMANTVLNGALIQALNLDINVGLEFIKDKFGSKGEQVVDLNHKVFKAGIEWAKANVKELSYELKGDGKSRMFTTGNDAFGLGLLAHGCKFYCAYPMSPSTGVLHYLAKHAHTDKVVVKQAEDELAVINYVVGAGHAGVRSACATSGGGYALMVEGVGLAAMLEVPVVVINVQRGGPSTGLPTKQEQSDINLMMGGNGDFPKIIIAPKDVEDAFYQAGRAMNLAEKYQCPVLILSDLYLSEHYQTVEDFDFKRIPIERGKLLKGEIPEGADYKRYKVTEDGISPRLVPGSSSTAMYCSASDEHKEDGEIITDILAGLPESLEVRKEMHAKRMRKEETMIKDGDIELPTIDGDANARITLLGWGSTYDFIKEACEILNKDGLSVNHLHFTDLYPMNSEKVTEILNSCNNIIAVENNMTNQMCKLIKAETGFDIKSSVNRYDGEPFTGEYIANLVKEKELAHA